MNDIYGNSTLSELIKKAEAPAVTVQNAEEGGTDPLDADIDSTVPVLGNNDEILELGEDFDFDGFQVVRREFFAHLHEPSISFNNCKFSVNSACLSKFPSFEYAQVLVSSDKKVLAMRPCSEGAKDSFPWCYISKGKRKPKPITCKLFFAKIITLMGWNPDYRYKILGKLIHANDEYMLAFDLTATEVYQRTFPEGQKPKTSRTPVFPAEWQNQFGLPYSEHRQSMQINIFDGYAIFAVKENQATEDDTNTTPITNAVPMITASSHNGGEQG